MSEASPDPEADAPSLATARPPAGELTLVIARGDLDVGNADGLERVLRAAVPDDRTDRSLVLDLRRVGFMDCAALAVLVRTRNRLGDRFWLAEPSRAARRLLELTRMTAALPVLEQPCDVTRAVAVHQVPVARTSD